MHALSAPPAHAHGAARCQAVQHVARRGGTVQRDTVPGETAQAGTAVTTILKSLHQELRDFNIVVCQAVRVRCEAALGRQASDQGMLSVA